MKNKTNARFDDNKAWVGKADRKLPEDFLSETPIILDNSNCVFDANSINKRIDLLKSNKAIGRLIDMDSEEFRELMAKDKEKYSPEATKEFYDLIEVTEKLNKPHKASKKEKNKGIVVPNGDVSENQPQNKSQEEDCILVYDEKWNISKEFFDFTIKTMKEIQKKSQLATEGENRKRIAELEKELKDGPPKDTTPLAKKSYIYDRKKELNQLKNGK
jgi:hypothetical protein